MHCSENKGKGDISSKFHEFSVLRLIAVEMSNPEVAPTKRKAELESCVDENSKKSKTDSSTPLESPGQENFPEKYLKDETLADTTSEEATESDEVQVGWIESNSMRRRVLG